MACRARRARGEPGEWEAPPAMATELRTPTQIETVDPRGGVVVKVRMYLGC